MGVSYVGNTKGKNSILKDENLKSMPKVAHTRGQYEKSLMFQPHCIALRFVDELGSICRSDINWIKQVLIWKKDRKETIGSVMPTSVKDRFNTAGEHIFHFVKEKKYYFDLDKVRIPAQTFENRPMGIDGEKEYPEAKRNKFAFNYRVRDAERKKGQPQFKASEEEIKNYKQVSPEYGKKKLKGQNDKLLGNRWMSGTPNFTHKKSLEDRLKDTHQQNTKESRAKNVKKTLSEVRLGIKPDFNKVNDPRGNHEGGPGSWRDNLDDKEYRKRWKGQKEAGLPATYIGPTGQDHNLLNNPSGKNIPNNWLIGPEPLKENHFAAFPTALCEIPILATCPEKGIVFDPFAGSGSTLVAAQRLGCQWIGIELNPDYIKIAQNRLRQDLLF